MPGRLRTSFRMGNLAEDLGILLLKGIAAVADVPRTEDVGIDAIATLLRRDLDGNCYAEDSFVVQLKSESQLSIAYRDHQLSWLLSQTQPMFIGSVSRKDARIALYTTMPVNQAVLALHANDVKIYFSSAEGPYRWDRQSDSGVSVWLGPPVISWGIAQLDDPAWLDSAYEILKRFLGIARREHGLLSLGQFSTLAWSTNDKESIQAEANFVKSHPDQFKSVAVDSVPNLKALLFHGLNMPEKQGESLTIFLLGVVSALRELGVDVDPPNLFAKLFVARNFSDADKNPTQSSDTSENVG